MVCLLWLFLLAVNSGHFFRVWAALRAAAKRPALPFVRTAFLAAALRDRLPRRRAAVCACRASAALEAALPGAEVLRDVIQRASSGINLVKLRHDRSCDVFRGIDGSGLLSPPLPPRVRL